MKLWFGNKNMIAYRKMETELLRKHRGKVAVFSNGKLIAIGKDVGDAVKKAKKVSKAKEFFVKELFSAKEQTEAILWL